MNVLSNDSLVAFIKVFLCGLIALTLSACGNDGLTVTTNFTNTQDIEEGSTVYFEQQAVGEVVDVKTQDQGAIVVVELDEDASELISSDAALVVNRLESGAPLQIYNSSNSDAGFIQDGQQLQGLDSMVQLGAWKVGDAIQIGSESLSGYVSGFQEYLQSEKFQEDKQSVQEQVNSAASQAQDALETIGNDLAQALEEFTDPEGEAAIAVEQLGEELSPLVQEIAKSGTELMQQLEVFTEGLQESEDGEQQTGQAFLENLVAMFEKLNHSIEQGVEEGTATDVEESIDADTEGNSEAGRVREVPAEYE